MKRAFTIVLILLLLFLLAFLAILRFAPQSSPVQVAEAASTAACLKDSQGDCLVMPHISGVNIESAAITLPDAFSADYQLIVMPFDREQQVLAVTWLPLFQELANERGNTQYWSIAALPDLNAAIRILVIGGISGAVREPDLRAQITVFFLEDQAAFLEALAIETPEEIQVFITDGAGVVFYRDGGAFSESKGESLREAFMGLP